MTLIRAFKLMSSTYLHSNFTRETTSTGRCARSYTYCQNRVEPGGRPEKWIDRTTDAIGKGFRYQIPSTSSIVPAQSGEEG